MKRLLLLLVIGGCTSQTDTSTRNCDAHEAEMIKLSYKQGYIDAQNNISALGGIDCLPPDKIFKTITDREVAIDKYSNWIDSLYKPH